MIITLGNVRRTYCMCISLRHLSSKKSVLLEPEEVTEKLKLRPQAPVDIKNDWIGPPAPVSNIRPMKFYISESDTSRQQEFREKRMEGIEWNDAFWKDHNSNFQKLKSEFIKEKLAEKRQAGETTNTLSPEEMSVFYKQFLDENYKIHIQYNREWYKKNVSLLWPALKVATENIIPTITSFTRSKIPKR